MGLPAPKHRNLQLWTIGETSNSPMEDPMEMWEISVPTKNSLYWSIMMSYLLIDSNISDNILQKLIGDENEMNEIKTKKNMNEVKIDSKDVQAEVLIFNPFENRHADFSWPNLTEVLRIFKVRLSRYSNKIKPRGGELNDELKLQSASEMLCCQIVVYLPDEGGCRRSFGGEFSPKIILFKYKDQDRGSKIEKCNIFCFGMGMQKALKENLLKENAPEHVLNKTTMESRGLPAPKYHNIQLWISEEQLEASKDPKEIWEIGVPAKNSLYWSTMMSYLLLDLNILDSTLQKLIGDENEMNEIKIKLKMNPQKIESSEVKREVKKFNPFKNRHVAFSWSNLTEVFRIFKLRLKRYSNKIKPRSGAWNDELKLLGASEMLRCQIVVYFPDDGWCRRSFGSNLLPKIILFQYKEQECGAKIQKCNIFHFGMGLKHAHVLKINALGHVLNKAKISKEIIAQLKILMNCPETHGKCFLPTLLQSNYVDVLPDLYKSPYIVIKLSEAGFDTDPTAIQEGKPSALCYALSNADKKYIQILYDYASNCRCLFDKCIRSDDGTLLKNLERLKDILKNDIMRIDCCGFQETIKIRAIDTLQQFSRFVEYQYEAVSAIEILKTQLSSQTSSNEFLFRKNIIETVLDSYLKYFYYGSLNSAGFLEKFTDYLNYSEFYENSDIFAFISFFDNFYSLKCCFGTKKESNFLHIEWLLFLSMMSNKFYPKYDHYVNCNENHDCKKCEQENNILRVIPFLHRTAIEQPLKKLLTEIQNAQHSKPVPSSISNDTCAFPQIIDALLMARLQRYISAALEESNEIDSNIAHTLAIERALQVIGESLKPPSVKSSVVSVLLSARLPRSLKKELIKIRNDLSHVLSNSVYGRLQLEQQNSFCSDMRNELKVIQNAFKIVEFTQDLRIEESITSSCMEELKKYRLESNIVRSFHKKCERRMNSRRNEYKARHFECMQLVNDVVADLQEYLAQGTPNMTIENDRLGQLKAIEYLLNFICKHIDDRTFKDLLDVVKNINQQSDKGSVKGPDLVPFLTRISEHLKEETDQLQRYNTNLLISTPKILSFLEDLRTSQFLPYDQNEIKYAVDSACEEAREAMNRLISMCEQNNYDLEDDEIECLFQKVVIPEKNIEKLRSLFESRQAKKALKYLKQPNSSESIKKSIQDMIETGSYVEVNSYANMLLRKIAFPTGSRKQIYDSTTLPLDVIKKLRTCITKKAHLLLNRLRALKSILIEEDDEIEDAWKFGRSQAMKYHMKFLMRQRYIRENVVHASLEMAFFDCLNILNRKDLQNLYEKSTHLFSGIDLRNVISHRSCIPETIGTVLDEDDFPSDIINKSLQLIEDTEAIEYLLTLFEQSAVCSKKCFVSYIETALDDSSLDEILRETIKKCTNWESYLSVFPLMD